MVVVVVAVVLVAWFKHVLFVRTYQWTIKEKFSKRQTSKQ